jgi:hypothetical protein
MASLALIVAIIFLYSLLIGPFTYVVNLLGFVPIWIKITLAVISIISGAWFATLPTGFMRLLGLIPVVIGVHVFRDNYN